MKKIIIIDKLAVKILSFFAGLFLMALGSVLTIKASSLGVQPWDVLHIGLHDKTLLTIGAWSIIIGFVLVVIALIMTKQKLKIGTILDTIFVGVFIDLIIYLDFLYVPDGLLWKVSALFTGTFLIAFGAAVVIVSNLGAGPRDTFMLAIHTKFNISIKTATTLLEVSALIIGFLLGGPVGAGTFLFCLVIGPMIEYSINFLRKIINLTLPSTEENELFVKKKAG